MSTYPWWLLLLALIGAIALGTIVLRLFTAIGSRPEAFEMTGDGDLGEEDLIRGLSGTLGAPRGQGGTARLLNNGDAFFPAIVEAIEAAQRSVTFMVYIWEDGRMSDRVFDALIGAAQRGVAVRVLADGIGGWKAPGDGIERLRAAGGRFELFHRPRFGKLTRIHRRLHRRAIVVDGRIAFTGGAAVMDKWLGDARNPDEWRDCMVELRGPIGASLQAAFCQLWVNATGELLMGPSFFPPVEEEGKGGEEGAVGPFIPVISSPSREAHPMRILHWLVFRAATESIYITNPYFVPDDLLRSELKRRAAAGVDVRVLVPNEHNDVPFIRWASRYYYEDLLEAGIRIYEYQPTMIHHKVVVADGRWSIVGSVNLDVRSKQLNQENAITILDAGFARTVEETFIRDLERAEEIHLERFRRRPLFHRAPERLFALFEEQF